MIDREVEAVYSAATKDCMLCDKPTTGSIGASGLHWKRICQPCKDKEDAAALSGIRHLGRMLDVVLNERGE